MRRAVVVAVIAGLLGAALVGPADARKKRKPIKFSASGTQAVGKPVMVGSAGLTREEFVQTCSIPSSTQGLDGFVVELPAKVSKVNNLVTLTSSDSTGLDPIGWADIHMFFFSNSCRETGSIADSGPGAKGAMPAGTKYVLVSAQAGTGIHFTFSSVSTK